MNVFDFRRARFAGLASLVLLAIFAISGSISSPAVAATGVSGQLENWAGINFGEGPGELFNSGAFGVDSQDGSTYILSNNVSKSQSRINQFSSTGHFQASVAISRQPAPGGLGWPLSFVGIRSAVCVGCGSAGPVLTPEMKVGLLMSEMSRMKNPWCQYDTYKRLPWRNG